MLDKNKPPIEVLSLSLFDEQKSFLDPLDVILKDYGSISEWNVVSIHLEDESSTTIGFAVYGSFNKDDTWIDDIMIAKEYQNKGYGTEALKYLINYIFETYDVEKIYLSCFKDNLVALNWYLKLGFKLTDDLDINGEIILVYIK